MGQRAIITKKLEAFKKAVEKDFPIERLILFGSQATGKATKDSDIDLVIVSQKFLKLDFIERGVKMYDYWDLSYPMDFLCYTPEEFKELEHKPSIISEALREGIEI